MAIISTGVQSRPPLPFDDHKFRKTNWVTQHQLVNIKRFYFEGLLKSAPEEYLRDNCELRTANQNRPKGIPGNTTP